MDKEKFTKNVIYIGVATLVLALQKFLLIPILTKHLGVEQYGVWTNIVNTVMLLSALGTIGMGPTIVRFFSAEEDKQRIIKDFFLIFWMVFITSLMFSVICYFASDRIATYILGNLKFTLLIKISCALIILEAWNVILITLYKALKIFKTYAFVYISYTIIELIAFWYLLSLNYGLMAILITSIVIKFALIIVGLIAGGLNIKMLKPDRTRIKEYILYGLPLAPTPFYNWIIRVSDQYIIGFFYSAAQIGIYSLHYSIGYLMFNLNYVVLFVLSPTITKLWDEKRIDEVRQLNKYTYKYLMMLMIPMTAGLFVFYGAIIKNISTKEFMANNLLMLILASAIIFASIYDLLQNMLMVLKKTKIITYISLGAAVLNISLNLVLVPKMGLIGAALSTLATFMSLTILSIIFSYKEYKFDFMPLTIIKFLIAAGVMSYILSFLNDESLKALILGSFIGAIIYFSILYLFKGIKKEEIKFFLTILKKDKIKS